MEVVSGDGRFKITTFPGRHGIYSLHNADGHWGKGCEAKKKKKKKKFLNSFCKLMSYASNYEYLSLLLLYFYPHLYLYAYPYLHECMHFIIIIVVEEDLHNLQVFSKLFLLVPL